MTVTGSKFTPVFGRLPEKNFGEIPVDIRPRRARKLPSPKNSAAQWEALCNPNRTTHPEDGEANNW